MEFNIVKELNGQFDPIVLIKADEKPEDDQRENPGHVKLHALRQFYAVAGVDFGEEFFPVPAHCFETAGRVFQGCFDRLADSFFRGFPFHTDHDRKHQLFPAGKCLGIQPDRIGFGAFDLGSVSQRGRRNGDDAG